MNMYTSAADVRLLECEQMRMYSTLKCAHVSINHFTVLTTMYCISDERQQNRDGVGE